jgi:surfeit locus 1 family protein
MGLASGFAWLGKWQLERAVISAQNDSNQVDSVVPLESIAKPSAPVTDRAAGHLVSTTGGLDRASLVVINNRAATDTGKTGFWLAGRVLTKDGASLAVVLGWAPTKESIESVRDRMAHEVTTAMLIPVTGRYMPSEGPVIPKATEDPFSLSSVSVAELINVWPAGTGPVYSGFLVVDNPPAGLSKISTTPPVSNASYNLLNLFYAIEWLVFAGFAFFMWYRLVRDRVEREEDEAKQNQSATGN